MSIADDFLLKLQKKAFPGVQEVAILVDQLKEEYNAASWSTRVLFPHLYKERCLRVNLGHFKKMPSPLRQELLPEDVPEPPKIIQAYDQDYMYDWDYVASTDPIHPVDTNYSHPLDGVDPCWILNHLTPEEFQESSGDVGFNASEADTMWVDDMERTDLRTKTWRETSDNTTKSPTKRNPPGSLAGEAPLLPPAARTDPSSGIEQVPAEHVEMVIREFWTCVSGKNSSEAPPRLCSSDNLIVQLNEMHISDSSGTPNECYSGLLTPPQTPPRSSTDGPADQHLYAALAPSTVEKHPHPHKLHLHII
ncbi:uncharacterized protein EKO05_0011350 [Ascochyta rabiei]|nr:uncharacterized protein EKO05_0011350 [Ascochyta rabiei]UPX21152.1 hypothetical protein EKO05_0011350 [Ascochyta rabiei]